MRFLALGPAPALALLAAVAATVLLLYLLKPSPRRLTVASTLIWRRVLRERKRTPDRLRWWLSLLLAAAIALSVALALTRPEVRVIGGTAQRVVLVLDNSTTLATLTSDGKTRWQHALSRASELIRSGGADSRYLIADTQRSIASPRFEEAQSAIAALDRLRVVAGGAPVFPPMAPDGADVRVVLVTDGVAALSPPPDTQIVSVFQIADNAGIIAFDVRQVPGDPRRYQALVEVLNASPGTKRVELQVAGAGGQPLGRVLNLAGGATGSETIDLSRFPGGPLRAFITTPYDALPLDDVAYAFQPSSRVLRIGLVSAGNSALERSLRLLPRTRLTVMTPQRFSALGGIDAWVFDRYAPARAPGAPALLFRPSRAEWLPPTSGDLGETAISAWTRSHPVTESLSLRDVAAAHALSIRDDARAEVIAADARQRPLILASRSGMRWLEVAFALEDSNLPLQAGFPVFLSNALNWMTGEALADQGRLGVIEVPLADAKVLDVEGRQVATREVPGARLFEAGQPGFYTAIAADRRMHIAVNLADPAVSAVNASSLAEQPPPPPRVQNASARWTPNPWSAALWLAALLLLFEWWTYNRRLTI
jgi:Ca-activated chloride channel homolog